MHKSIRIAFIFALAICFSLIPASQANAATFVETFGNSGSCGIQTAGMTATDAGTPMVYGSTNLHGNFHDYYNGQFGMSGCYVSLQYIKADVVFTFPSNSRPSQFSFYGGAVDGVQQGLITYTDATTDTFTITNTTPSVGETRTVTGNGKLIQSFTVVYFTTGIGTDFWFLDNLSWAPGTLIPTTTSIAVATIDAYKGVINNLVITASAAGKVTTYANGKKIAGCISRPITTSITCQWKPTVRGSVVIRTDFAPLNPGAYLSSAAVINASVISRSTRR
jgi:hypothetical protein